MPKHLPEDHPNHQAAKAKRDSKKRGDDILRTALQAMNQEQWGEALISAFERLSVIERATQAALAVAGEKLAALKITMDDLLDRAVTHPDGRKLFPDAQGRVIDEHGDEVTDAFAAHIVWPADQPDYGAFTETQDAISEAGKSVDSIMSYQVDSLGNARNDLEALQDSGAIDPEKLEEIMDSIKTELPNEIASFSRDENHLLLPDRGVDISIPRFGG